MKICQECGHRSGDEAEFCTECGAVLPKAEPAQPTCQQPDPQQSEYQRPPYQQQSYQQQPYQQQDYQQPAYQQPPYQQQDYQQPAYQQPPFQQPMYQQQEAWSNGASPAVSTKQEFLNLPENKKLKNSCRTAAIISYICAGVTLLVVVILSKSYFSILDVGIMVGLGIGIQLKQSRVCAIILLVYAVINMIISIAVSGSLGGWLVLAAGIVGVLSTNNAEKQWKLYQQNQVARQNSFYQQPPQQPPYQQ